MDHVVVVLVRYDFKHFNNISSITTESEYENCTTKA